MAPNIYCCGAGTAADTEAVTGKKEVTDRKKPNQSSFVSLYFSQNLSHKRHDMCFHSRYGQLPATTSPLCY